MSEAGYELCSEGNIEVSQATLEEELIDVEEARRRTRDVIDGMEDIMRIVMWPVATVVNGRPLIYWSDMIKWFMEVIDNDWKPYQPSKSRGDTSVDQQPASIRSS